MEKIGMTQETFGATLDRMAVKWWTDAQTIVVTRDYLKEKSHLLFIEGDKEVLLVSDIEQFFEDVDRAKQFYYECKGNPEYDNVTQALAIAPSERPARRPFANAKALHDMKVSHDAKIPVGASGPVWYLSPEEQEAEKADAATN